MKLFSKIKAFFCYRGENAELNLSAAEIKNGRVYLHPEEDKSKTYCIRSSAVEIFINPRESISEEDLEILDTSKVDHQPPFPSEEDLQEKQLQQRTPPLRSTPLPLNCFTTKMKTITFSMYPEEYDMLISSMNEKGYKKTEFLLACVSSAKKNSMQANYQRYETARKERRIADRQAALQAQRDEFLARQQQVAQ